MFFENMETERLLLKNISMKDRAFIYRQFSDEGVCRFLFDAEPVRSISEAEDIIRFYLAPEPRAQHRWIIVQKDGMEKIGTCGFHCWEKINGCTDIAYDLQPTYWGKGIMTEAMRAILPVCTQKMGVCEVHAHIYFDNKSSIRLAERLGFTFDGKTVPYTFHGKTYPHLIYTLHC